MSKRVDYPMWKAADVIDTEDGLTLGEKAAIVAPAELWDAVRGAPVGHPSPPSRICLMGPIEEQSTRATCTSFATVAAVEFFFQRHRSRKIVLSKQYANGLFMRAQGRNWCDGTARLIDGMQCLAAHGTCIDDLCPYFPVQQACIDAPCHGLTEDAIASAKFGISRYCLIDRGPDNNVGPFINNPDFIKSILCKNLDVILSFNLAICDKILYDKYNVVEVLKREGGGPEPASGSHAVLIVGYASVADIPYFICKDSRAATTFRYEGYTCLSYSYVQAYANYGAVVLDVSDEMPTP